MSNGQSRLLRSLLAAFFVSALAACGGGGGDGSPQGPVASNCLPGLITGFSGDIGDEILRSVPVSPGDNEGGGNGTGEGGSVGGDSGNGIGGDDGQYRRVDVTIETPNGRKFGPWPVDDTKGMVTFVPCGALLPVKVTFEGRAADSVVYDEGLARDVSFAGKQRIGLINRFDRNGAVTPFNHALYDRAQAIGVERGIPDGWKDAAIVEEAHAALLAIINDQLPGFYRLADLRRLPIMLNAGNDRVDSNVLTPTQNGIYGAVLGGFALAGSAALPASTEPALEAGRALIADLSDGKLDSVGPTGSATASDGRYAYSYDSLWSSLTVGTGVTAARVATGTLRTDAVPIGYVRGRTTTGGAGGGAAETEYVLGSNGNLVVTKNPGAGGVPVKPAAQLAFSQLYRFGDAPVVALRRDGKGLIVFPSAGDGTAGFEVPSPDASLDIVEMFDPGYPAFRLSDGSTRRLEGRTLVASGAPAGLFNYACRSEFAGALANPADPALGDASGQVCYGLAVTGQASQFRNATSANGRQVGAPRLRQISGNGALVVGLTVDGGLVRLDADHTARYRSAGGAELPSGPVAGATLELVSPAAAPVPLASPQVCWLRTPFAIACDGKALRIDYAEYTGDNGEPVAAGPVTGVSQLPIPTEVWRTRANRRFGSTVDGGLDAVFIGVNSTVYDLNGQVLNLPLDGAPLERTDQVPLAPLLAAIADDNVLTRAEAQAPLTITGTAQPGSEVKVTLGSVSRQTGTDAQGKWSVTFTAAELPATDGDVPVLAVATNAIGESQPARSTLRVSVSVPPAPTISPVAGDNVVTPAEAAGGLTISGSATAGTTVTMTWSGVSRSTSTGTGTAWSIVVVPGEVPAPGDTQISVIAANGNGASPPAVLNVRVQPPTPGTPTINAVTGDNIVSDAEAKAGITINGTATAGATVAVSWQGVAKSTTANGEGGWSVAYPPAEVPKPGTTTVTATASNAGGQSAAVSLSVRVDPPAPTPPPVPTINAVAGDNIVTPEEGKAGVTISGTAAAGATVAVSWQGVSKSATVGAASPGAAAVGAWSVQYGPAEVPQPGTTTVTATASNTAGPGPTASQSVVVQSPPVLPPPPPPPRINPVAVDDVVSPEEAKPGVTISGTAEVGATVSVNWQGVAKSATAAVPAAGASGIGGWSVQYAPTEVPQPGRTTVQAIARNAGGASEVTTRAVDIQAPLPQPPGAPSIDRVTGDNLVSVTEAGQGVTITGIAQPGSEVAVSWETVTKTAKATVAESTFPAGYWAVSYDAKEIPAAGRTNVSARATNAGGQGPAATMVVQVAARNSVTIVVAGDNFVSFDEQSGGFVAQGRTLPGSRVTVEWDDGGECCSGPDSRQVTANSDGTWSISYPANARLGTSGYIVTATSNHPDGGAAVARAEVGVAFLL